MQVYVLKQIHKTHENNLVLREIVLNQVLDHPNIVKLNKLIETPEKFNLIFDYCNQGDLFYYIKSHAKFAESLVKSFVIDILSSIVYCHDQFIAHRDIKPENIGVHIADD